MKVSLVVVGKVSTMLAAATSEYERRAARYWSFDAIEVKEEKARKGLSPEQVRTAEGERLLQRIPDGSEIVALTRDGKSWSSNQLAEYLNGLAVQGKAGAAFLIGGALGLSDEVIERANRTLSISPMTLTHELARLVFTEQLYRAGTIVRGEPYHKART